MTFNECKNVCFCRNISRRKLIADFLCGKFPQKAEASFCVEVKGFCSFEGTLFMLKQRQLDSRYELPLKRLKGWLKNKFSRPFEDLQA